MSSTDEDVVQTIAAMVGAGRVTRRSHVSPLGGDCQDQYHWEMSQRPVVKDVLEGVLPYMHRRRGVEIREMLQEIYALEEVLS